MRRDPRPEEISLSLLAELEQGQTSHYELGSDLVPLLRHCPGFAERYEELDTLSQRFGLHDRIYLASEMEDLESRVGELTAVPYADARQRLRAVIHGEDDPDECDDVLLLSWCVTVRLLELCLETTPRQPRRGRELALLALRIALQLHREGPWERDRTLELVALAWAHLGNAFRVTADLRRAGWCFERVSGHLRQCGPMTAVLGVEAAFILGAYLRDNRELDTAREYLKLGLDACCKQAGCQLVLARGKLNLASLDFEAGDHAAAVARTRQILEHLDPGEQPFYFGKAALNLTNYQARAGHFSEARESFLQHSDHILTQMPETDRIRWCWIEALIASGLHQVDLAQQSFQQARRRYLDLNLDYDAAVVSLELSLLFLETGRPAAARQLCSEMLPVFERLGIEREASVTVELLRQAVAQEQLTAAMVRAILKHLGTPATQEAP